MVEYLHKSENGHGHQALTENKKLVKDFCAFLAATSGKDVPKYTTGKIEVTIQLFVRPTISPFKNMCCDKGVYCRKALFVVFRTRSHEATSSYVAMLNTKFLSKKWTFHAKQCPFLFHQPRYSDIPEIAGVFYGTLPKTYLKKRVPAGSPGSKRPSQKSTTDIPSCKVPISAAR